MAKLILISVKTASEYQLIGDIASVLNDADYISDAEKDIFDILNCLNVTGQEVSDCFESKINPDLEYPKFPFSIAGLTEQQKEDLASEDIGHDEAMEIIDSIPIKETV